MKFELTVIELGEALKKLDDKYELEILVKMNLSGGWMTMMGKATIENIPSLSSGCHSKSMNIIDIRVKSDEKEGSLVKLTGAKNKKFNVTLEEGRFKEISMGNLSIDMVKLNHHETKVRIDEDIIIKISDSLDEVISAIK